MKKQTAVKKLELKMIDIINELPYDYSIKVALVRAFEEPFLDAFVAEEKQINLAVLETLNDPNQVKYKGGSSNYFNTTYENEIEILEKKAHEKKVKAKAKEIFERHSKTGHLQKEFALTELYGRMIPLVINSPQHRFLQDVKKEIENL